MNFSYPTIKLPFFLFRAVKDTYLESKAKPEVYLTTSEEVSDLSGVMEDLIGCSVLHINKEVPLGTAMGTVGNKGTVHVLVKGLVDPVQEINRLVFCCL